MDIFPNLCLIHLTFIILKKTWRFESLTNNCVNVLKVEIAYFLWLVDKKYRWNYLLFTYIFGEQKYVALIRNTYCAQTIIIKPMIV